MAQSRKSKRSHLTIAHGCSAGKHWRKPYKFTKGAAKGKHIKGECVNNPKRSRKSASKKSSRKSASRKSSRKSASRKSLCLQSRGKTWRKSYTFKKGSAKGKHVKAECVKIGKRSKKSRKSSRKSHKKASRKASRKSHKKASRKSSRKSHKKASRKSSRKSHKKASKKSSRKSSRKSSKKSVKKELKM